MPGASARRLEARHDKARSGYASERKVAPLSPPTAEGLAARTRNPERDPNGRADLGASRGKRVVPTAPARRVAWLLDEPVARPKIRRSFPPPPSSAGSCLRSERRMA